MKTSAPLQKRVQQTAVITIDNKAVLNPLQLKTSMNAGLIEIKRNPLQLVVGESAKPNNNPLQLQAKKENKTGLPDKLKENTEALSGLNMDDVKVHYNSDKPSRLHALAYTQGTDIHITPGQEKHLPHEAWHVAQQKQGRVNATRQMKSGVNINDDKALEKEADAMGSRALNGTQPGSKPMNNELLQGKFKPLKYIADETQIQHFPLQKNNSITDNVSNLSKTLQPKSHNILASDNLKVTQLVGDEILNALIKFIKKLLGKIIDKNAFRAATTEAQEICSLIVFFMRYANITMEDLATCKQDENVNKVFKLVDALFSEEEEKLIVKEKDQKEIKRIIKRAGISKTEYQGSTSPKEDFRRDCGLGILLLSDENDREPFMRFLRGRLCTTIFVLNINGNNFNITREQTKKVESYGQITIIGHGGRDGRQLYLGEVAPNAVATLVCKCLTEELEQCSMMEDASVRLQICNVRLFVVDRKVNPKSLDALVKEHLKATNVSAPEGLSIIFRDGSYVDLPPGVRFTDVEWSCLVKWSQNPKNFDALLDKGLAAAFVKLELNADEMKELNTWEQISNSLRKIFHTGKKN